MNNRNLKEKEFFEKLNNIFVGSPIEGYGGYVNLLMIKQKYYNRVIEELKKDINNDEVIEDNFVEDFYTHLYNFFNRYFNECGSIFYNKTSYNDKIYEQVYKNNEDVSLFWKTHMLYYVKSDILFNNVDIKVRLDENNKWTWFKFNVGNLKNKQNNEKMELIFKLDCVTEEKHDEESNDKTFNIIVLLKEGALKSDKPNEIAKENDIDAELYEKAIAQFRKQSTVDFFINKDAKKFLTEQLDLYIHNILLNEKTEFDERRLRQLKTIKKYACKLIDFISQFENELVLIWNKPKFVLNSNYVISIDKISDEIRDMIKKHKNIKEQISEWKKLGMVDDEFKFNELELVKHPHLPIDTKYFKDLELKIVGQFNNLDEELNGRLIHSENFQALNLLQNKYKGTIQCIYIDPPFNTGDDFQYIDGYQDSTWLSLMRDRIDIVPNILSAQGSFWLHLDYNANVEGKYLLEKHWKDITEVIFDTNGTKDEETDLYANKSFGRNFQLKHQTIYYCRNPKFIYNKLWRPNRAKTKLGIGWLDIISKPKVNSPKKLEEFEYYICVWKDGMFEKVPILVNEKIYPIGDIWSDIYSFTQSEMRISENISFEGQKPENLMRRIIQTSTNENGLVCDFFSGSGTTICTAHKLNRKWIGVELGEHFNEFYYDSKFVLKVGLMGRIKNVINGDKKFEVTNSEQGRKAHLSIDINWQGGGFFKYFDLEQYEDVLSRMKYSNEEVSLYSEDIFNQYIFFADEKLAGCIENKEKIEINLDKIYKNIDLPETISFIFGEPIKKITQDEVILEKSGAIKYNVKTMNEGEKKKFIKIIKKLIWWGI